MKRFLKSVSCAWSGILKSVEEGNMKIHIFMAISVVVTGVYLRIAKLEWLIIWLCFGLVWVSEIVNTAVEDLCDIVKKELNLGYEKTKWPRDLAAGAVLVAAGISVVIGLWIFVPRIFHF